MVLWAEHQFKLNKPDQNGIPEREHLEQVERQTGYRPPPLEPPVEFPDPLVHIWSAFCDLNAARSMGFSAPNPITYTELKAYMELTGTPLSPVDVDAIKRLDVAYLGVANG